MRTTTKKAEIKRKVTSQKDNLTGREPQRKLSVQETSSQEMDTKLQAISQEKRQEDNVTEI